MGTIAITVLGMDDIETELQLNDVIYAPNMSSNLFSLAAAYDTGFEARITSGYGLRIFYNDTLVANSVQAHNLMRGTLVEHTLSPGVSYL